MSGILRRLVALLTFGAAASVPAHALACWDGRAAGGDRASISVWQDARWSPAHAREMAVWLTRIEALVPEGHHVDVTNGLVTCDGPTCPDVAPFADDLPQQGLSRAFDRVAEMFAVPPPRRTAAAGLRASVYTVQVFAGARDGAIAARARVDALRDDAGVDLGGFYEEGGFPAVNPIAHVLDDGGVHRVVVGAHRTMAEAREAERALSALGVTAFVRTMPAGEGVDEPFSSASRE